MATNEKIKLEIESQATGKGFEKVQKDAQKTKQVMGDLGKGVKNLGSIFGSIGGKLGNAFDSILKGGIFGAITFGIGALVEKWKQYKQEAEEAEKKTLSTITKDRIESYNQSLKSMTESWKDINKEINDSQKATEAYIKLDRELVDIQKQRRDLLVDIAEQNELPNASSDEQEKRIKEKYNRIRTENKKTDIEDKSNRQLEDAVREVETQKELYAQSVKNREEAERRAKAVEKGIEETRRLRELNRHGVEDSTKDQGLFKNPFTNMANAIAGFFYRDGTHNRKLGRMLRKQEEDIKGQLEPSKTAEAQTKQEEKQSLLSRDLSMAKLDVAKARHELYPLEIEREDARQTVSENKTEREIREAEQRQEQQKLLDMLSEASRYNQQFSSIGGRYNPKPQDFYDWRQGKLDWGAYGFAKRNDKWMDSQSEANDEEIHRLTQTIKSGNLVSMDVVKDLVQTIYDSMISSRRDLEELQTRQEAKLKRIQ